MSFGAASTRWWLERGQHRKDAHNVERFLAWLQTEIGQKTPIAKIDNNVISRIVAKRRLDDVSPATVNRSALEPLRAILRHADFIGQDIARIDWRKLKLKEPPGRVREMTSEEEARLFAALRPDFHALARFLIVTGVRRAEGCMLQWTDVALERGEFTVRGKGGTVDRRPLADAAIAILRQEQGKHPARVFTYCVRHPFGGRRGDLVPIAPDTFSTAYWRARKTAGLEDLRIHDLRHTAASRITRVAGIQAAGRALGHKRITTTERYSHVSDEDLRAALNKAAPVAVIVETKEKKA